MKKHTLQTLCTATLISLGLSFTAMGEERITDVSLIFSYDQSPEAFSIFPETASSIRAPAQKTREAL